MTDSQAPVSTPQTSHQALWLGPACLVVLLAIITVMSVWKKEPNISAATCVNSSVEQNIARADIILTGSVFSVIPSGQLAEVIIQPDRLYKGSLSRPTLAISARPVNTNTNVIVEDSAGDLHFQTGQPPYLLFVKKAHNGQYLTSACWGSRQLKSGLTTSEAELLGSGKEIDENK